MKTLIRETLCEGEWRLTAEDVMRIEELGQSYLDNDFIRVIES